MTKSFLLGLLSPKFRLEKIRKLTTIEQFKDEEGFTLGELIVVVMMISILSSIAIPQFITAANKAKQKEATAIITALVKGATAYQTEYGVLPETAEQVSKYAKFQQCTADPADGDICRDREPEPVRGDINTFFTTSGNYKIKFLVVDGSDADGDTIQIFQVIANPNGGSYEHNGSAVMGCYNPVDATSEIYEFTSNDKGPQPDSAYRDC